MTRSTHQTDKSNHLKYILDLIPCYIFWKDRESVFLGCNQLFAQSVGLKASDEIIGKTDYDLPWTKEESDAYRADDNVVMQMGKPRLNIEETQTLTDGRKIVLLTNKVPFYDETGKSVIGVIGVYQDISEIKKAQKKAELANEAKSEFIENMQHDLRTPAYGICAGLAEVVQVEREPRKLAILSAVYKSAKRLFNLCVEVTDFDRMEHNEKIVTSKKFDLKKLLDGVIELHQAAANNKLLLLYLNVAENVPVVIKSDYYRIKRILINLVGNAIKFTPRGSIQVNIKSLGMKDKQIILQLAVKDTGIGIPKDKQDSIYEKFTRGTPSNRGAYTGLGLGLQLVKRFVQELDGDIEVQSADGAGTAFYVTFPADLPLSNDLYSEIESDEELKFENDDDDEKIEEKPPVTIENDLTEQHDLLSALLIEDDPLACMAARNSLRSLGCSVMTADSVQSAKNILDQTQFDVVVSDIGLPDGEGFDIARYVKTNQAALNYKTPFFALTAHGGKGKVEEAEQAGFLALFTKPLLSEKFKVILDTHVRKITQNNTGEIDKADSNDQIIDWNFSKKWSLSDDVIAELMAMLCSSLPMDIQLIKDAYAQNDTDTLRALLHKLKGGFCYCGVPRLQKATNALHDAIHAIVKNGLPLSEIDQLFSDFYNESQSLLKEYERTKKV